MDDLERSYELEFWNSKETADRLDNNTQYHTLLPCEDLEYANKQYKQLIKKYEYVLLKIVGKRVLQKYHKTSIL